MGGGNGRTMAGVATLLVSLLLLQRDAGADAAMAVQPEAQGAGEASEVPPDVPEFWPDAADDLTTVSWAHAVNSRALLDAALQGDVMMLEADVSVAADGETPIMAHPPATASDLSLQQFLDAVVASGKSKGVKLDFKSTQALERAAPVLAAAGARALLRFPMWLNADIVAGPGGAHPNVSAERFLALCADLFPGRTLSVGWTTGDDGQRYTHDQVQAMQEVLASANVSAAQPITFPVRAAFAARSRDELLGLLQALPHATLTLWGSARDQVDNKALLALAHSASFRRVYVDLPNPVPGLTPGAPAVAAAPVAGSGAGGGGGGGGGRVGHGSGVANVRPAWAVALLVTFVASLRLF